MGFVAVVGIGLKKTENHAGTVPGNLVCYCRPRVSSRVGAFLLLPKADRP